VNARAHGVNPWLVLVLVCLAQFMVILDATIVNVALPSIQADLGLSESSLQWIVNAYALLFGGFLLLGGRAGDLIGRKRVFLAGLVLFTAASFVCGIANGETMLIVSRGIQGLGAALVSPAALSIVTTTFREGPSARRRSASGQRSRSAAARSASCSAGSSSRRSPGHGSSSSTSRSGSPPSSSPCASCPSRRTSMRTRASISPAPRP
jgi:MFS family permease